MEKENNKYFNKLTEEEVRVVEDSNGNLVMISDFKVHPDIITKEYFHKNLVPLDQIKDLGDFLFDED